MDCKEKQEKIEYYAGNNMRHLKKLCNPIIAKKSLPEMYRDDLYSDAQKVLMESVESYRDDSGVAFKDYLKGNIKNSFWEWSRNSMAQKRCNVLRDKNGKPVKVKDENGKLKKIIIPDVRLDAPVNEEDSHSTIGELTPSGFDINNVISELIKDENVELFLESLSDIQRRLLELRMSGMNTESVKRELHITEHQYQDNMTAIRENEMISLFNKKRKRIENKMEYKDMEEKIVFMDDDCIMDLDTTDSYRMDKYSLESLIADKQEGELDCAYVSQRVPFAWTEEQINKYFTRVLNNQPITEMVICEMVIPGTGGGKISYLIDGLQRLSYAEAFKENRIPIKAKGAEFTKVYYKKFEYDENGNKVLDEYGRAKYSIEVFNLIGKYYKDLPEFLQKRFDKFNVNVTRYFDCTPEMIDYHLRNYNNHVAMSKNQYGITCISNDAATKIKKLSQKHAFFKDNIKCTNKSRKTGVLEEVVVRSMMCLYFMDDWKKDATDAYKFIDENATDEQFSYLHKLLDDMHEVCGEEEKALLTTTNTYTWVKVFDNFTKLGIENGRFIEFMKAFGTTLHSKEINGRSYDEVSTRNTKDKITVNNKVEVITNLMREYFGESIIVDESITEEELSDFEFVKENVSDDVNEEDFEFYKDMVDDSVKCDTPLYEKCTPALIALMAIACQEEKDTEFESWAGKYAKDNITFSPSQKVNFMYMKNDFEKYCQSAV